MLRRLLDRLKKPRARRSHEWPKARREWLRLHPSCEACGTTDAIEVHHRVPVHVDPTRELDPTNFITLCESNRRCHLVFGHLGDWKRMNQHVADLSRSYLEAMAE